MWDGALGDLPVEDKGIGGIQQTEEADAVDNRLPNAEVQILSRAFGACESCPHYERGHSDCGRRNRSVSSDLHANGTLDSLAQNKERMMRTYVGLRKALKI